MDLFNYAARLARHRAAEVTEPVALMPITRGPYERDEPRASMGEIPIRQILDRWSGAVLWEGPAETMKDALHSAIAARATLSGATLSGATGVQPERSTSLLMLLDQPGAIRAYKLVDANGVGPFNGGVTYRVGETVSVENADTDPTEQCGAGINVATLDWCLANYQDGYRVLVLEFTAKDIAAIPTATDGKFRLHRATVVAEKDISALVAKPEPQHVAAEG